MTLDIALCVHLNNGLAEERRVGGATARSVFQVCYELILRLTVGTHQERAAPNGAWRALAHNVASLVVACSALFALWFWLWPYWPSFHVDAARAARWRLPVGCWA
jgi:hypothetical protein